MKCPKCGYENDDNAYFCGEWLREDEYYDLSKGNYAIKAYGQEFNFTVDELDVNALPTITAEKGQSLFINYRMM